MEPTPNDSRFVTRWEEVGSVIVAPLSHVLASVLVVDQHHKVDAGLIDEMPHLKFVVSPTTGLGHIDQDALARRGIKLLSLKGEHEFLDRITAVADFTMRMILEIARPIGSRTIGMSIKGKRLGIIGLGRIGRHLAVRASAFGMIVDHVDVGSGHWDWDKLLKTSDFVSVHAPEEAGVLITRPRLALMKRSAWLINTARSCLVDEDALRGAIEQGLIKGAVLDVTSRDWTGFTNVITTNHIGGYTLEDRIATDDFMVEKLKTCLPIRRVREI